MKGLNILNLQFYTINKTMVISTYLIGSEHKFILYKYRWWYVSILLGRITLNDLFLWSGYWFLWIEYYDNKWEQTTKDDLKHD